MTDWSRGMGDDMAAGKTPAWVTRLRRAATATNQPESTETTVLSLAAAVAPAEPAWAQEVAGAIGAIQATAPQIARDNANVDSAARYAICAVGTMRVAISVDHVLEVRPSRRYAVVPGVAGFVRGVANVKGQAVGVLSLADLLGIECVGNPTWERLLLVKPPGQERTVGLVVDRVIDLTLLPDYQIAKDEAGGELAGFLCQVCQFQGEPVRVLDVEGLLGSGVIEILAQTRRADR